MRLSVLNCTADSSFTALPPSVNSLSADCQPLQLDRRKSPKRMQGISLCWVASAARHATVHGPSHLSRRARRTMMLRTARRRHVKPVDVADADCDARVSSRTPQFGFQLSYCRSDSRRRDLRHRGVRCRIERCPTSRATCRKSHPVISRRRTSGCR